MTPTGPRDGESVEEECEWYGEKGHRFDGSYRPRICMCGKPEPVHPPEKVAADKTPKRPHLHILFEGMARVYDHMEADELYEKLESSLASSVARVEELEADRQDWILAAMSAMEALYSINKSTYCMPPSQYGMMIQAIRRVQDLWEPELKRRRAIELERDLAKSKEVK